MLDRIEMIFDEMKPMMRKLKKASYEKNMNVFLEKHGHYFDEMCGYVEGSGQPQTAMDEVAGCFTSKVRRKFESKGKIPGYIQADLNFFMIYYVFPALLKQEKYGKELADRVCLAWAREFPDNNISYTDYDSLYKSFREKIFGIF